MVAEGEEATHSRATSLFSLLDQWKETDSPLEEDEKKKDVLII